jgi:drug/metabolite transporter (DMT)-like permease
MKKVKSNLLLILTAFIWGNAFVAQSVGMDYIGPWTFTCLRSFIGGFTVLLLMPILDKIRGPHPDAKSYSKKTLWITGIICGIVLGASSVAQQIGIQYTSVGKAGFLTALYIIFVPLLGILIGKKTRKLLWVCVGISLVGFYFLSMTASLEMGKGDLLILFCAVGFAVHIMVIDHYSSQVDGVRLSCIQFFVEGLFCLVPMIAFEHPDMTSILAAWAPILYAGVMSSGLGYTFQILGQKDADPTAASMLLSLESVFSALAGLVILHQVMSIREICGCVLIFTAILLAQLPSKKVSVESEILK